MAEVGASDDEGFESSEDQLYFLALEKVFIEERGSPLYLSPKDWQVARKWHEAGIPIEWVERTLRELFAARRAKGTADKVISLGYCRRSVEAAWKRYQKMQAPVVEAAPPIDVAARLESLAGALPEGLRRRDAWCARMRALEGEPEAVEEKLRELDREVFDAATQELDDATRSAVAEALEQALARLAGRLRAADLEGARDELRERILRERLGLPVLSLFAPEAEP